MDAQRVILTWFKAQGRMGIGYMQVLPFKKTYEKLFHSWNLVLMGIQSENTDMRFKCWVWKIRTRPYPEATVKVNITLELDYYISLTGHRDMFWSFKLNT